MPLDPGRDWLAAGITGLQRQREWDAVATLEAGAAPGEELAFVALPDGTFVLESEAEIDPTPFAAALANDLGRPYRAVGVRRPEVWVVGAVSIDAGRLDPEPRGNELELTWNGSELTLTIDDVPADPGRAEALSRVARQRVVGPFAARAHRLRGDLFELSVLAL